MWSRRKNRCASYIIFHITYLNLRKYCRKFSKECNASVELLRNVDSCNELEANSICVQYVNKLVLSLVLKVRGGFYLQFIASVTCDYLVICRPSGITMSGFVSKQKQNKTKNSVAKQPSHIYFLIRNVIHGFMNLHFCLLLPGKISMGCFCKRYYQIIIRYICIHF